MTTTTGGRVTGAESDGVCFFLGIPYAAAPSGPLRLRPPVPVRPWEEVRSCVQYGPTPPKNPYRPPFHTLLVEPAISGESYLNLNVWTPHLGGDRLPVLVWIHGGAFQNGSGAVPQYNGMSFARDGVVTVTLNYRLGAEGFLFFDDGMANLGLHDQVAALEWVQQNIAAFGGDPDRVTVAGESAGAMSVVTLMAMPRARGLFRAAIAQSGAGHHVMTSSTALLVAHRLAELLDVNCTRDAVAEVPVARLLAAQQELVDEVRQPDPRRWQELAFDQMPFEPVIDGDVLPARPVDRIRAGASSGVTTLIGTNTDENRFFLLPTGAIDAMSESVVRLVASGYGLRDADLELYRQGRADLSAGDLCAALVTDWFFRIPALRVAEARSEAPTWVYEFAWRSHAMGGRLGACHALEVPFVFDTLGSDGAVWLTGSDAPQTLADEMHRAWVRFVTDGDPGWPAYTPERRATMVFGQPSQVVDDPRPDERTLWSGRR